MTHTPTRSRRFALAAACALGCLGAQAWAAPDGWPGGSVKGNGILRTQQRTATGFKGVSLGLPAQVQVRIGSTESVTLETDENLLPLIETVVEKGQLEIRASKRNMTLEPSALRIVVQARQIEQLDVGGSGTIDVDAMHAPRLKIAVGGSGGINVKSAECEALNASMGGSGKLKVAGSARKLRVSIGGSGDVQAGDLRADEAVVNIGGSGRTLVWARNALTVSIAGSGDVRYYGDPQVQLAVAGSGGAKRLGPSPR